MLANPTQETIPNNNLNQPNINLPQNINPPLQQNAQRENNNMFGLAKLKHIENHKILFLSGMYEVEDPLSQSFWKMVKNTFFPHWQVFSLTTILLTINIVVFIVSVSIGFRSQNSLLQINEQTLTTMGVNNRKLAHQGQFYRLLTNNFIHLNINHLISNIFTMIILVTRVQYSCGSLRTGIVYLLSGILGGIFSDLLQYSNMFKCGSTTSLFGLIGLSVGYFIINWNGLKFLNSIQKFKIFYCMIMLITFMLLFNDVATQVDWLGHGGALIYGIFLSCLLSPLKNDKRQLALRIILLVLLIVSTIVSFTIFYI